MKKKEVFILSGDIQSGKTTSLLKWSATRNDVYGILTPIENGKRFFMDISSGEKFSMEANADEIATIQVGKYSFSMNSFSKAVDILSSGAYNKNGWLVIDEIGPLEISGRGFDEALKEFLQNGSQNLKLILVVRDSIKDAVIARYSLDKHLIKKVNFLNGQDALV